MTEKQKNEKSITPNTILLDIVSRWPDAETVIRRYDDKAGVCLCCSCLFDTLEAIADKYSLNLTGIIREINDAVAGGENFLTKKTKNDKNIKK